MSEKYAQAFLTFTKDSDEDIRVSVFYDIAEFPELFQPYQSLFIKAAKIGLNDSSVDVQKYANKAYKTLLKLA